MRHLVAVAAFALDLVGRGRTLPTVIEHDDGPRAAWRPLVTGGDAQWAQALTLALPPSARAAAGPPEQAAPTAGAVVADAVDTLVDAGARSALPNVTHIGRRSGR